MEKAVVRNNIAELICNVNQTAVVMITEIRLYLYQFIYFTLISSNKSLTYNSIPTCLPMHVAMSMFEKVMHADVLL